MTKTKQTKKPWRSPFRRANGRGCGFVFFLFILVLGSAWGAGLGLFVAMLDDAKTQVQALDTYRPKEGSKYYSAEGREFLGETSIEVRQLLNLNEMPLHLQKAFLSREDDRFFEHRGVRLDSWVKVLYEYSRSGRVRGASSITMQVVRNVEDVTGVSRERTVDRKLREMLVALQIEREFTKDEILELYLNVLFLGGSAHGVEAASQLYFGKSSRDITLAESATLAALTSRPNARRPDRYPDQAQSLRDTVLHQMLSNGFITQEEHDEALAEVLTDSIITPEDRSIGDGPVQRRERLGGILNHYYREAA